MSSDSFWEALTYNCEQGHFLVVLFVSFVFQTAMKNLANNPRTQESVVGAVLLALAIVDVRIASTDEVCYAILTHPAVTQ